MKIISLETLPFYQSNSLNRGVWTFTSLVSDKSNFIFLEDHLERLLAGAHHLFPANNWKNNRSEIEVFLTKEFVPSHYFRLSIADDTLLFTKKAHQPKDPFVNLGNARSTKAASLVPDFIKSPNYLMAEMELIEAKKRKMDDVVFFDQQNIVTEASTSNIFVVLDGKTILTPRTSSMVLAGVTRKKLIEFLKCEDFRVQEVDISQSELESSREIWLTNSVQGIRLVDHYEKLNMFKDKTIYQTVCQKFGRFGEGFNHE